MPEDALPPRPTIANLYEGFAWEQPDTISLMLQSLLDERFKLRVHWETRELPVYEVILAGGTPKIRLSDDQNPLIDLNDPSRQPPPRSNGLPGLTRGSYFVGGRNPKRFGSMALPLSAFIHVLINDTGRPVIDKTGLNGLYDITLEWTPDNLALSGTPGDAPLLSAAMQEQLGLRLVSTKGPVKVLVIDSVEKPSPN
jgi:uncharacterized protein (TIGR03435 family)